VAVRWQRARKEDDPGVDNVSVFQMITAAVALWGAGLSTFLAVRQLLRDRRRLSVKVTWGLMDVPHEPRSRGVVTIVAANTGHRPIEITDLFFLMPDRRSLVVPGMQTSKPLPCKLEEGQSLSGQIMSLDFADGIVRGEYPEKLSVTPACRDGTGTVYRGALTKVGLAELLKLDD
jgi:hypothetical protein